MEAMEGLIPIASIQGAPEVTEVLSSEAFAPINPASGKEAVSFGKMVSNGLDALNQQMAVSQTDLQQLAVGNTENLHQIMIRLEETRLSFQLFMQVRSRLLEAYQDIMKMQV